MILFGAFGIAGGVCALLLPDTVGFPLPNSFDDVEEIKRKGKPLWKLYHNEDVNQNIRRNVEMDQRKNAID